MAAPPSADRIGLSLFLIIVVAICVRRSKSLFLPRHGRSHRLAGLAYLTWLCIGAFCHPPVLVWDVVLGLLGIILSLTAARDFPHHGVKNEASGTLHVNATVTNGEMIEHAFYQGLNLCQALYLHALRHVPSDRAYLRLFLVLLVTSPWLLRSRFPVNSFSKNWRREEQAKGGKESAGQRKAAEGGDEREMFDGLLRVLYRVKKWQYVFYKHVVLHGLNISIAFPAVAAGEHVGMPIPLSSSWRLFWVCLNTAYVMEFFLQSLVKRKILRQGHMIALQLLLMSASSVAALPVLSQVRPTICAASLLMNFYGSVIPGGTLGRGHDAANTLIVASGAMATAGGTT